MTCRCAVVVIMQSGQDIVITLTEAVQKSVIFGQNYKSL